MKKQTKRGRGCGVRNTKKNRKKRRQTRKLLKGGSAVMPEDAPKTRKRNVTPGNNSKERKLTKPKKKRRKKSAVMPGDAPNTRKVKSTPGNNSNEGKLKKPKKKRRNKRQNVVATAMGAFRCAMCEKDVAVEAPKHGPNGDGFTPRQCLVAQRAQGKHTLCRDCWFDVFVPSEDHSCPGCKKELDPQPKEIGKWIPDGMVDLTDSP